MEELRDRLLNSIKAPLHHPAFYIRAFAIVSKIVKQKPQDPLLVEAFADFEELSRENDRSKIQESVSIRTTLFSRNLAQHLIDEKGEIHFPFLSAFTAAFKAHLYSLGPDRQYDAIRSEHILKVLRELQHNKEVIWLIKKVTKPVANKWAEDLIRATLGLASTASLTDVHARMAVLAAWLCLLRQNVGSCFATAPAEIIQSEQPEQFLQDLSDLLATGQLKRTFGGVEYSVPLCASFGLGELRKPIILNDSEEGIFPEVWRSAGLIAAFEAADLLKKELAIKEKIALLESWIKPLLLEKIARNVWVTTAEEIIQKVLMQSSAVSEKQLREYQKRAKKVWRTSLIFAPEMNGNHKSKEAIFSNRLEAAQWAFKILSDNALLKAWEFTIASFCDTKQEFSKWNLYVSLGMRSDDKGGIGECIYLSIQEKLDQANRSAEEIQLDYERAYTECKIVESRFLQASSEKEAQWLRIDYQSKKSELYFVEEQRELAKHRCFALISLYETLYPLYLKLFKDYFQEVYDPEMQEIRTCFFDDAPAGFRLLYKHGRSHSAQWTRIFDADEFVDALAAFFISTEPEVAAQLHDKRIEKDLSEVVTAVVTHIRTKRFIESAFERMALSHGVVAVQDPLDHLEKIEKKPWCYTSGGTMNTLVSCYYRREEKPQEIQKWMESETELVVFLADVLKQIPPRFLDPFLEGKRQSLLMESPTHAFLLKPLLSPFKEMWQNEEFTYTHIRDRFILPGQSFGENLILEEKAVRYLIEKIAEKIPHYFHPTYHAIFSEVEAFLTPRQFRHYVMDKIEGEVFPQLKAGASALVDEIDALLHAHLPLTPLEDLRGRIEHILSCINELAQTQKETVMRLFDQAERLHKTASFIGAQELQEMIKALICLSLLETNSAFNVHLSVTTAAQELGYAWPKPLLFADSNWVKDLFGFTVNPGSGKLELWRFDPCGSRGLPMSSWKQWIQSSSPAAKWGVYIRPYEYGQD